MKYDHMVKYNGAYYSAGAEVPAEEPNKEEEVNVDPNKVNPVQDDNQDEEPQGVIPGAEVPAEEPVKAINKRK